MLSQETLYLSINLFDRYIQKIIIDNKKSEDLNKIALACLFIASKNEEIYSPYLNDILNISNKKYTKKDITLKEDEILSSLDFQVITISPLLFLKIFCQSNDKEMKLIFDCAQFFLELCLIEPKFCELKSSLQASICLYLARKCILNDLRKNNIKVWTFDLIKNFFGNIYTKNYMAMPLYIKYMNFEYSRVSYKLKNIFIEKNNEKNIKTK